MKNTVTLKTYENVIKYATCEELERRIENWKKKGVIYHAPTKFQSEATCYAIRIQFNKNSVLTFYFDYFPKERAIGYWEH